MPRFLGIDFGWQGKPSGLAALEWESGSLYLLDLELQTDLKDILAWVDRNASNNTVIGIDAPIVIPNASGMREADKLAHSFYGKYHAGAYPASRQRNYWKRTTGLSDALRKRGFQHGDSIAARAEGRFQIEVHPHAAIVQLNALPRILKYKRGTLAERRAGLGELRKILLRKFPAFTPRLALPDLPEIPEKGSDVKGLEDRLDAIVCAYVAAHWWHGGRERNDVLGDSKRGYIVVPKRDLLRDMRENYARDSLDVEDLETSPFAQFEKWFAEARSAGLKEPNAMTLATADARGRPSARIVLLKGLDEHGFVFFTNYESQKGRELAANPHAALVFYWAELERQVRVVGVVQKLEQEESETYFHSRPAASQIGAWASRQSEPIEGRAGLEQRVLELEKHYAGRSIPRPPYWGGYRLRPTSIEFWQGRPNRLHDRLRYIRSEDGSWQIERLSP